MTHLSCLFGHRWGTAQDNAAHDLEIGSGFEICVRCSAWRYWSQTSSTALNARKPMGITHGALA